MYSTHTYTALIHHWSSGFRYTLRTNTPGVTTAAGQQGTLSFEDEEHDGFSPAGIYDDPLVVPPPSAYSEAFLRQLAPQVTAAVQRDIQVRATQRRTQCSTLPADWSIPWVQCWAESALWGNGQEPPPTGLLQVLANSAGTNEQPLCR